MHGVVARLAQEFRNATSEVLIDEQPHPSATAGSSRSCTAADLRVLAALTVDGRRLAGAVVGRALVDGALSVEEAMAACEPSG